MEDDPVVSLSPQQAQLATGPQTVKTFLEGPFGTGKTTAGVARLAHLLEQGEQPASILVLLPSRVLGGPYYAVQRATPGEEAAPVLTLAGLARRMVGRFWERVAGPAGFARPESPPVFLNHEGAQYHMGRVVAPLLQEGLFESLAIERGRLYSQLLSNLNLAAAAGLSHTSIGERLKLAQGGSPEGRRLAEDAQLGAERFRRYCLDHNLLDFSLLIDLWREHLWAVPAHQNYLIRSVRHLIADNLEENIPVVHDLLADLLPGLRSALLLYNQGEGLRTLLGADPTSGYRLKALCPNYLRWEDSYVMSEGMRAVVGRLREAFTGRSIPLSELEGGNGPPLVFASHRYYPQMLDWVSDQAAYLVHERGIPPEEIAILAPSLSDALRFALSERLGARGVLVRSLRPSRALQDEPAARALLTLAALAHPDWGLAINRYDLAYALVQAIAGLDLVRGQILIKAAAEAAGPAVQLAPFDTLPDEAVDRITPELGERYERLRTWLEANGAVQGGAPGDFFTRLHEEVLSQPGFGFYQHPKAAETAANLAESLRGFQAATEQALAGEGLAVEREWALAVQAGLLSAQYLRNWMDIENLSGPEDPSGSENPSGLEDPSGFGAILLSAAYTFALSDRTAAIQFWLSPGSYRWTERPYQPLTHPYVLGREWQADRPWTDREESLASQQALERLVVGLAHRCRQTLYLAASELSEAGMEERGMLMKVLS